MSKKTDVAVVEAPKVPATVDNAFDSAAGVGLENVGSRDIIIPRITILQALSPQLNSKKPEFIEGAKIGDICDVGTGEIFDPPLLFLPVHYIKQWLEWAPRSSGKGLVKIHDDPSILDQCTPNDKKQPTTKDGNYIAETAQFFGLNLSAGERRCFLPMGSTQLKKARRWLTLATSEKVERADGSHYTPPLFYRAYKLSTVDESNAEGDWSGWRIERGDRLQDYVANWRPIFDECMLFRDSLLKGEVKGDIASVDDQPQGGEGAM